MLRPHRSFLYF